MKRAFAGTALSCALLGAAAAAQDVDDSSWRQFGGPRGDFTLPDLSIPADALEGLEVAWRRKTPEAYSGVVVAEGTVFTMSRTKSGEVVLALAATKGWKKWVFEYERAEFEGIRGFGLGPRSTPLVVDERVFVVGLLGTVHALDRRKGEVLWRGELWGEELGGEPLEHGYAASPLAVGGNIVLPTGGRYGVVALDQATGELRWGSEPFQGTYSSARVFHVEGERQIVVFMAHELIGLDPSNGRLLWRHPHSNQWRHNISPPIAIGGDRIFLSSPQSGARLLRLAREGASWLALEEWSTRRVQVYHSVGVSDGVWIYASSGASARSDVVAVEVATGEIGSRLRGFGKANLLALKRGALLLDEKGVLALLSAEDGQLEVRARAAILDPPVRTAPTLVGSRLYARNMKEIVAFDLPLER